MIREYAREQLAESGEADALRERHAGFFLALAETAAREFRRGDQRPWLGRLEREHDNLRAALAWSREAVDSGQWLGDRSAATPGATEAGSMTGMSSSALTTIHYPLTTAVELGLQLAAALEEFWYRRRLFKEALHHLLPLLAHPAVAAPTVTRVRALSVAGRFALIQHSQGLSRRLHEESLAFARELEDRAGIAAALLQLGRQAAWRRDGTARPLVEEGLAIRRELGDPRAVADALTLLADVRRRDGDLAAERALAEESLAIWRALGDRARIGAAIGQLGQVISRHGDRGTARPLIEEALATARELNDKVGVAQAITNLGFVAHWQEDYRAAQALFEQSLPLCQELDFKNGQIECLFHLGVCRQQQGDSAAAYARFGEMLAVSQAYGVHGAAALALLGDAAADLGRWEETAARCAESLRSLDLSERSDRQNSAWALTPLARVALARGRPARAARLLAAAPSLWAANHAHWWLNQRADFERIVSATRAQLGEAEFAAAWAEGQAMPVEQIIAEALEEAPGTPWRVG